MQTTIDKLCGIRLPIAIFRENVEQKGISFLHDMSLGSDAYSLTVESQGITIRYSDDRAAFYAVSTIKQLVVQCGTELPGLTIDDHPDFPVRGAMLDISRDKMPRLETLYHFVDLMVDLKLNHLQLYIEGFPFAYPSFPDVWRSETPMTGEELIDLDRYCAEHFVELVPNQNCFGHMGPWLSRNEFGHLAEETAGKALYGRYWKAVLNPLDPDSIDFVEKTFDDLLPNFSSTLFNVCCDEVALGQDKTKELCERVGAGRVFLDYVLKIYELVKKRDKQMMLWGDVIFEHPELMDEVPEDVIVLDWGYTHNFPYDDHGKILEDKGLQFYVCPGTGSWRTITGRTGNTIANLQNAAVNGKKHGATGYLITDWGDRGHWQYLPVSYPGFVYGAGLCWSVEDNRELDIAGCLDTFVFKDENRVMGDLMLELGKYSLKESNPGIFGPNLFSVLIGLEPLDDVGAIKGITEEGLKEVEGYLLELSRRFNDVQLGCSDAQTLIKEMRNAVHLLLHGIEDTRLRLSITGNKTAGAIDPAALYDDLTEIINAHIEVWLERNRVGGLSRSLFPLEELRKKYSGLMS